MNNALVKILRCTFEIVDPSFALNAAFFDGERFVPDPRTVPDKHWHPQVSTSTTDPESVTTVLDQYRQLARWQSEGQEPVRNVRLWVAEEPQWREIGPEETIIEMGDMP